jgi:hypothetical protein
MLLWRKLKFIVRTNQLTKLLTQHAKGEMTDSELITALIDHYARFEEVSGDGGELPSDFKQLYDSYFAEQPQRQDMSDNRREYLVDTTVSRSNTTERLHEYQKRGVQKVQVIAYIDSRTTAICRSMNNRIFEIGPAAESLRSQESLVQDGEFWKNNKYFYQTGTEEMSKPWLPPYHYNCRTRIIPYVEPVDPYEQALDKLHNLEPLEEKQVQTVLENAKNFKFAKGELERHLAKHGPKFKVGTKAEYMQMIREMISNPMNKIAVAMSGRDGRLTLYIWSPHQWMLNGQDVHNLVILSLDEKRAKTFHPKSLATIKDNFNPEVHGKIRWITEEDVYKGDNTMVGKADVKDYEDIIDYFEWQDGSDELEIVARLRFEREWDTIAPELKERILAVDRIVLERFADLYEDDLTKRYIATIRRRLEIEEGKR